MCATFKNKHSSSRLLRLNLASRKEILEKRAEKGTVMNVVKVYFEGYPQKVFLLWPQKAQNPQNKKVMKPM